LSQIHERLVVTSKDEIGEVGPALFNVINDQRLHSNSGYDVVWLVHSGEEPLTIANPRFQELQEPAERIGGDPITLLRLEAAEVERDQPVVVCDEPLTLADAVFQESHELGEGGDYEITWLQPEMQPYNAYREVVLYATDREQIMNNNQTVGFGNAGRPKGMSYGYCLVTLPWKHRRGNIESPCPLIELEDPNKHVLIRRTVRFADVALFSSTLRRVTAGAKSCDVMIFVHGAMTPFDDAIKRAAQIRLDTNFPGVAFAYSWPSRAKKSVPCYLADYDRVDTAATKLRQLIEEMIDVNAPKGRVHLVGHSLGCLVTARAIKKLPAKNRSCIGEIVLAAPDICSIDYPELAKGLKSRARRVTVYAAPDDRALQFSTKIRGGITRVGSRVTDALYSGVDAIDASSVVNRSVFGDRHSYVFEKPLMLELQAVLRGEPTSGALVDRAQWLERRQSADLHYYFIKPLIK
jgi:esterase/lipase superfamily enzyme